VEYERQVPYLFIPVSIAHPETRRTGWLILVPSMYSKGRLSGSTVLARAFLWAQQYSKTLSSRTGLDICHNNTHRLIGSGSAILPTHLHLLLTLQQESLYSWCPLAVHFDSCTSLDWLLLVITWFLFVTFLFSFCFHYSYPCPLIKRFMTPARLSLEW
jgi:hypothetical protein